MTLINGRVTRHRTYAMISSSFRCSEASPPPEVHFLVSYEDWTMSYWSYKDECKPVDEREAVAKPTASLGVSSSGDSISSSYPKTSRSCRTTRARLGPPRHDERGERNYEIRILHTSIIITGRSKSLALPASLPTPIF